MVKLKELVLRHIDIIRKEHEKLANSNKYSKIKWSSEHEVLLAYAIADFLVFSCYYCGSVYNIDIGFDTGESQKEKGLVIYKVTCSKCRAELGRIIASDTFVVSDIKKLYQFPNYRQIIHKTPIYQDGRVIRSLKDLTEEDLDKTVSEILRIYYDRLLHNHFQISIISS